MTKHFNRKQQKYKRKNLKNRSTISEKTLWQYLKGKKINRIKFRRQYSVNQFIIDFYSPELKLAIEIDGGYHSNDEIQIYDKARQELIESFGIKFLRFSVDDVYYNIDKTLGIILNTTIEISSK